ncbi:hypothetical protein HNQ99_002157 [Rhizorhapis suberifaciens]|uniref:Uncharacterized protein n=1 Tax=Rhizorhapis suberifaciens TaxID=13656 RepID=A0A840HWQ9_9SPHN|nr:hypothetical protein [Rhizorhapis suberifaciens]
MAGEVGPSRSGREAPTYKVGRAPQQLRLSGIAAKSSYPLSLERIGEVREAVFGLPFGPLNLKQGKALSRRAPTIE